MAEIEKITFAKLKETYKAGILIPEIQRDYVMGAGGKSNYSSKDKLVLLLDSILKSFEENKDFDFSCIITFCKDNDYDKNPLEIYDGQQRLTTLVLLILLKLQREGNKELYESYTNWYTFCGRPVANDIICKLSSDNFDINEIKVKDFSSFSMRNLLQKFDLLEYNKITSDYLLNHIKFDKVDIASQSEIEQFFMDLNSGIKLKEYELYKAKFVNSIIKLSDKCDKDDDKNILKKCPHKLDNEWLNTFKSFASFSHPAEEYEIAFIKYCIFMTTGKEASVFEIDDVNCLIDCFNIMESLSKIDFRLTKKDNLKIVEFAWGTSNECTKIVKENSLGPLHADIRGAYWNLQYNNNQYHLYHIIKDILLDAMNSSELHSDLVVWAYITTLSWPIDYQNEYIRTLKILLNNNTIINTEAYYAAQKEGQYLYYSKYCVYGIPQYYGKHFKIKTDEETKEEIKEKTYSDYHLLIKDFITSIYKNRIPSKELLDKKDISEHITTMFKYNGIAPIDTISSILDIRLSELKNCGNYNTFYERETENNGIISDHSDDECYYYIADNVILMRPVRECLMYDPSPYSVLLKCHMDKLYEKYSEKNDNIVKWYKFYSDGYGIEKCFWNDIEKEVLQIPNRKTETATTYEGNNIEYKKHESHIDEKEKYSDKFKSYLIIFNIIAFVKENETQLKEIANQRLNGDSSISSFEDAKVDGVFERNEGNVIVQFSYLNKDTRQASKHYGFYYSTSGSPAAYKHVSVNFEDKNGVWKWHDGDNSGLTKKIRNEWYYYVATWSGSEF